MLAPPRTSLADRLNQRVFDALYGRSLVYNTCWEDPELDRAAMRLTADDTVVMITSAGCNALDYAIEGPRRIHAIDANPRQGALLELKQAGIRRLDYDDFFTLFGGGSHPAFPGLYRDKLRADLSPWARSFWDHRTAWFSGGGWRNSFYFHGLSGLVARLVRTYLGRRPDLGKGIHAMLDAEDLEHQRSIYDSQVAPLLWTPRMQWAVSRQMTMSLLGVPHAQTKEVAKAHAHGVAGFIRASVDRVFRDLPLWTNYFWTVYLRGSYTRDNCPRYLSESGFHALKSGLVDRIQPHTGILSGFLQEQDVQPTKLVLLDHMDWMSHYRPADLAEEWDLIRQRAAPGAQVLFRTADTRAGYLDRVRTRDGRAISEQLRFDTELSTALHARCRVGTYGGFHIGELV
jgi:S-adenosylmethionine-diacylglycerol 3-amino-3-carboxypropyl transferase